MCYLKEIVCVQNFLKLLTQNILIQNLLQKVLNAEPL